MHAMDQSQPDWAVDAARSILGDVDQTSIMECLLVELVTSMSVGQRAFIMQNGRNAKSRALAAWWAGWMARVDRQKADEIINIASDIEHIQS